jgi:aspartyl-tRNA(Asn)/glutamyl-tRNA(Gln) amidotransferase subunit B
MRSKEFAHDYRYFPDPDLLPLISSQALVQDIRREMPELPDAKHARFVSAYGIAAYDAGVLTATRALADYFESVVRAGAPAKGAASWISVELLRRLRDAGKEIEDCPVAPAALAELLAIVERGEITAASGKKVFAVMFDSGKKAADIIAAEGMAQISDTAAIETIARAVVAKSPDNVAKYRSGSEGVFKFFVGQVMKETRGQANPQIVNEILKRVLLEG